MRKKHTQMNPRRKERLWERLYHMDGFGLADYLNEFIRVVGAQWRATQHGEYVFLEGVDGEIIRFGRWDLWRENVSYYFEGMCAATPYLRDEIFCDVFVFKLCRMMLSTQFNRLPVDFREPPRARWLLFC
jgi:hypothetical protein